MKYDVRVFRAARKDVEHMTAATRDRLYEAARALAGNPRPAGCTKLTDREGWRLRVGDYRILYRIDDEERIVEIVRMQHRSRAYR